MHSDQAASFKEFCTRPENAPLVAKQQKKEISDVMKLEARVSLARRLGAACLLCGVRLSRRSLAHGALPQVSAERFQECVLSSDVEAQRNVAPFLEIPALRRIVQTLTNDPRGDFAQWATNPRIMDMLHQCKAMLDEGRVTEAEVEHTMLSYVKARSRTDTSPFPRLYAVHARGGDDRLHMCAAQMHTYTQRSGIQTLD